MAIRTYTNEPGDKVAGEIGACIMTYSDYGWGKSHALGTIKGPIAIINTEPRDPRLILSWRKEPIKFFEPETFDDVEEILNQMEKAVQIGKFRYKGVGFDSLSFSQSSFKLTLEDNRFEARKDKGDARPGYVDRFRLDQADWGPIASMMKRITASLNRLSRHGIVVVANATMVENPRWDRALKAAPAFQGKEFPGVVNGYFDFILFVIKPPEVLKDGRILPPIVAYRSDVTGYEAGDFTVKCCNASLLKMGTSRLDYGRMMEVVRKSGGIQKEEVKPVIETEFLEAREPSRKANDDNPFL